MFAEAANRIFSYFMKTWSKVTDLGGKVFKFLFQLQINLEMKISSIWLNQINFPYETQKSGFILIKIIVKFLGWEPEKYFIPHLKWSRQATHGGAALDTAGWGIFILIPTMVCTVMTGTALFSSKIHQSVTVLVTPSTNNNVY